MDIAVIGSNMVDLISYIDQMPKAGETLEAAEFELGCGGKGANQAVAAARMGADVMMVTRVGDDLFADNTLRNLQQAGIDTHFVKKVPGVSSGVAPIFVDRTTSQNRILIVKGANNQLLPADIDEAADALQQCRLIILQLEIPLETVYAAIDFARRHHIKVILNPAPASRELDIRYACQCEFFIPNETELEILTGMPVDNDNNIRRAGQSLLDKGLRNLIVTLGQRGALWMTDDRCEHVASLPVAALDTSGAGDAFIGCFAQQYIHQGDVLSAMQQAVAYAAYSVTGKGTQRSYPDAAQFRDFIATRQHGV
ncbi:ribokinase [Serratia sp. AKBS12]|uniref:ribokinase n=1 Tax=Serratia sp. AKBS12 TaxID=2974597 RepID=UPI0021669298|nr:ribokinase [Serratia sp. AKBS12]MCS3409331.1 ribokinase [Serratia sp. AKBS12]